MKTWICKGIALIAIAASAASAQDTEISFKSTELAPGIFMLEGQGGFTGGNLGVMTGPDGVVLIDDGVEQLSTQTLEAVGKISNHAVDFVINTHSHGDHVGGNPALSNAGATIIGHDNVWQRLSTDGWSGPDGTTALPDGALPTITFSNSMTFHLNGHTAFVFHVAAAHTDGDAVIFFRDADVIHTGDVLFNGLFPFIDLDAGGSLSGYIAAQEDVLSLAGPKTRIIPGHGPLASKADLQASHDMLASARDRVQRLIDSGKSEAEVVAADPLADFDDWSWDFITTERITQTVYHSLAQH